MNTNKKYLQTIVIVLVFAALLFAAWFLLGPGFFYLFYLVGCDCGFGIYVYAVDFHIFSKI